MIDKIAEIILKCVQPMAIIVFVIAGIASLILRRWHQASINLGIALANFMIFYGDKIFLK